MRLIPVLLLSAGVAASASAGDFSRPGPYIGLGGTFGTDMFEDDVEDVVEDVSGTSVELDIDNSWGLNSVLGYRVASFLATELQYEYIDSFQIDVGSPAVSNLELTGHVATLNLKLVLPTWRIQPYLLAGLGAAYYTSSGDVFGTNLFQRDEWVFAGRVGGGIDFYLTEHLVLNVGATTVLTADEVSSDISAEDVGGLNYVAIQGGLLYRF
jgi:opacity protein-like surface antigen